MPAETNQKAGPRLFKTQTSAVQYLVDLGYKTSKSAFSRAVGERKVAVAEGGQFSETALLAYANLHLDPSKQLADSAAGAATVSRLEADAELKRAQADRQKLKLERELGQLMPRAEHSRDLAARAQFFKREVQNFIYLQGAAIIHLVGGEEGKLKELINFWMEATADWMHTWSEERSFLVENEAYAAPASVADELEEDAD